MDGKLTTGGVYTSRNEDAVEDFSSPVWQKTAIPGVAENNADNKEHNKGSARIHSRKREEVRTCRTQNCNVGLIQQIMRQVNETFSLEMLNYNIANFPLFKVTEEGSIDTKPQGRRRSSVFPAELMEEKLTNLLQSTSALRARESIKYMITVFK